MPGENLQKLSKEELHELREVVKRVYFYDQGWTKAQVKQFIDDRELDKLIDSLIPDTVEKLREQGLARGFISKKKFFIPSKIVGLNGKPVLKESD